MTPHIERRLQVFQRLRGFVPHGEDERELAVCGRSGQGTSPSDDGIILRKAESEGFRSWVGGLRGVQLVA